MTERVPQVVVAGAGGMGALFGAVLHSGGLPVTLYDENAEHVAAIVANGLRISGFGGERVVDIPATGDPKSIAHADIVLFQCKSHGTRAAARSVHHLVEGGAVAISFQNGLGNEEVLGEVLGEANVLGGLTTMAGLMLGPGHVRDFSRVPSYIGELGGGVSDRATRIASTLTAGGLETHASVAIVREIWNKLIGNIAMSAVSGATDLTSAQALAVPALRETSLRALDEAVNVAHACGIEIDREAALKGMETISVPGGTGDNKSSLCVDLLHRRPSEVDFIYGTVIARARERGVPTPTLETLSSIVKGIESHYMNMDSSSMDPRPGPPAG
ncbi:MAG: ketopantoate reductase family protein [Gammaproteobacteria bacterium]